MLISSDNVIHNQLWAIQFPPNERYQSHLVVVNQALWLSRMNEVSRYIPLLYYIHVLLHYAARGGGSGLFDFRAHIKAT